LNHQKIPNFQVEISSDAVIKINEGEPTTKNTVNHSLIPISLNELNNLVKIFNASCPITTCIFNNLSFEPGKTEGIRRWLVLKCECGHSKGSWMLPPGINYSLIHNIKSNGLSTTKVNNFLTSFNIQNLDLKSIKIPIK
jgi:hypothetical protein